MSANTTLDPQVMELLELSRLESPYAKSLLSQFRRRLISRLLQSNRIDQATADYLLE